jgi:hypothetical protein
VATSPDLVYHLAGNLDWAIVESTDMGVRMRWGNKEKTQILFEMDERWEWDEFYPLYKRYITMMDSVPHRVHVLYHLVDKSTRIPPLILLHLPRLMRMTHEREDRSVIVGRMQFAERFLAILGNMGLSEYTERYQFVDTLEEAYQFLAQYEANRDNNT